MSRRITHWVRLFKLNKDVQTIFCSVNILSQELASYLKEEIKFLVEDILRLIQQIKDIDSRIKDHIDNSEDYRKLLTFPGIKETSAAVILAYVNSRNFRGVNHFWHIQGWSHYGYKQVHSRYIQENRSDTIEICRTFL